MKNSKPYLSQQEVEKLLYDGNKVKRSSETITPKSNRKLKDSHFIMINSTVCIFLAILGAVFIIGICFFWGIF